jgi:hypothetical protein
MNLAAALHALLGAMPQAQQAARQGGLAADGRRLGQATSQPQGRPVPGLPANHQLQIHGAQALQQQQNLMHPIQDPTLQGGHAQPLYMPMGNKYGFTPNLYQRPGMAPHLEEDYGINGTDMQGDYSGAGYNQNIRPPQLRY